MKIEIRNQSFFVSTESQGEDVHLDDYADNYVQKTFKSVKVGKGKFKKMMTIGSKYYIHDLKRQGYIFPISKLREFLDHLIVFGYTRDMIHVSGAESSFDGGDVELKYVPPFEPRDEQDMFIQGMLARKHKQVLIEAVTGYGKTFMVSNVLGKFKKRVLFYINSRYIAKWVQDIHTYFDVDDSKIFIIQGSDSLREFIENDPLQYQFIIASNSTMINYIEDWYNGVKGKYPISPEEFMEKCGIKVMVSDESHQFFFNLYKATISLNPNYLIGLSATLITKDRFISSMHHALFSTESRLGLSVYKKYTIAYLCRYTLTDNKLNVTQGSFGYNHKKYETSLLCRPSMLANYLEMITSKLNEHFITRRKDNEKAIIYASSLDFIYKLHRHIKNTYNDLDVRMFIGESDMKDALEPDIIISHQQSLGAAIDIKGLITVVSSINLDSPAANIQMLGRLREIPDREVRYIQLYAGNLKKHTEYIRTFRNFLHPRVKKFIDDSYDKKI